MRIDQAVLGVQVRFAFRRAFAETTELSHDCGQGDLCRLSGFDEVSVFGLHVRVEACGDEGRHVERLADVGATAANE